MNNFSEIKTAFLLWIIMSVPLCLVANVSSNLTINESLLTLNDQKENKNPIFSIEELKAMLDTAFFYYDHSNIEKSIYYAKQVSELSKTQELHSLQIEALIHLGKANRKIKSNNLAITNYNKAIDVSEFISDSVSLLKAYRGIATAYKGIGQIRFSISYLLKIIDGQHAIQDEEFIANTLSSIATRYKDIAEYDLALKYVLESVRLREKIGEPGKIGSVYLTLANIYRHLKDYKNAQKYTDKAMIIYVNEGKSLNRVYNLHGLISKRLGNNEAAMEYFKLAFSINEKKGDVEGMGRELGNISSMHRRLGQFQDALKCRFESLKLMKEARDIRDYSSAYSGIANAYMDLKEFEKAELYLDTALHLSNSLEMKSQTMSIYENYYELYLKTKNHEKALKYNLLSTNLRDSIFEIEKFQNISEMNAMFEVEQQAIENALLKRENEIQKVKNQQKTFIIILCGVVLMIMLLILLRIVYRNKFKKENLIDD